MPRYKEFKPKKQQNFLKPVLVSLQTPVQWITKNLSKAALLLVIVIIAFGGFIYLFYYSDAPGIEQFNSCKSLFVKIREKPTYGIIVDEQDDKISSIHILGVNDQSGPVSINIKDDYWVQVYFSEKFSYSQISQLLRLSKLETGSTNYCWLAEQLSLLTGVPLEFMVVRSYGFPVVSNIKVSDFIPISGNYDRSQKNEINLKYVDPEILEDGTKVSVLTFTVFRDQFPDLFKIKEVTDEQAFVEVYNSSPISGYASLIGHKFTMLGIEVSRVGNASAPEGETAAAIVYVRNKTQYKKTLELILSALPVESQVVIREGRPNNLVTTGDIVVILLKR